MGFFNKVSSPASGTAPLSKDRVKAALEAEEYRYRIDEDGDILGSWEDGIFYFIINGDTDEILHVRGVWDGVLSPDDNASAQALCNEWNSEKLWPKVYVQITKSEKLRLLCEHTVDYEPGVTDEQILQHLKCAIVTGCSFFEKANETFPAAAAAAKSDT